ncbi:MAG: tRNA (adenosine(37)-N6)-threonylcarbamoyltransferase complex dimerization subunit type 1 TsaB [Rhizobiaceae bacterium]|nr:tRNA (adenosine(37)-N6)-threonylcarbamoyltransferase complex dimerization subunit type 1 TsaB [Rhizobiaceae bacterium]
MKILAIDTAANLCAACIFDTEAGELGRAVLDLGKGHAEHLITVIDDALAGAGLRYADLHLVGVAVGPGSFTGIRVGVAAARGLALALGVQAVGVTTLDALAEEARDAHAGREVLAVIDARRDQLYLARYDAEGTRVAGPSIVNLDEAVTHAPPGIVLTGSAAHVVAEAAGGAFDIASNAPTADISAYALLASRPDVMTPPRPLYLRDADAKPQEGFAVARKAD